FEGRHLHAEADIARAHRSQADVSDRDAIVGSFHAPGEKRSGKDRARAGKHISPTDLLGCSHIAPINGCTDCISSAGWWKQGVRSIVIRASDLAVEGHVGISRFWENTARIGRILAL